MAKTTPVTIGADVSCTDGACGKVSRVVIDQARAATHLVVDRDDQGRLVPLALVEAATGGIRLRCTIAEFENLDPADTTVLQDSGDSRRDRDVLGLSRGRGSGVGPSSVTWDTLPFGEVAVRGGEHVHGTDGDIGQVQGLVMDPGSGQVTTCSSRRDTCSAAKVVAIPIGAVTDVGQDGIQLNVTKQHVQNLPPGDIYYPGR